MWLVMLKGLPGCGKSTVGRALSKQLGWPIIDKDDVKNLLDGQAHNAGPLSYATMLNIARTQLLQGLNVICDSPFVYPQTYEQAQAIAAETRASLVVVELVCSDENQWKQRILARQALDLPAHHTTDWETAQRFLTASAQQHYIITHPRIVVDTVAPLYECVGKIVGWLERLQPADGTADARVNYYLTLPRKRMGAGALFHNAEGQLLIVNPTYRPDWLLPGGSVDEDESPLEAVRREVKEELGLEIPITRLLCLDYVHREQPKTESLQFIFAGGLLRPEEIAHIVLQESELSEYRFVALEEAASLLHWRIARRVEYCLTVQNTETVIYLEDSQPVEFSGL